MHLDVQKSAFGASFSAKRSASRFVLSLSFFVLWPEAACKKSRFSLNGDYEILVECRIDLLLKKLNENADFSSGH